MAETPESTISFIAGRVVDDSGKPLEGVRITTNDSATYSDSEGAFLIGDRPCLNPQQLMAYLDGFPLAILQMELVEGSTEQVVVTLSSIPVCVRGVVKDSKTLLPIGGATVELVDSSLLPLPPPVPTALEDGSYMLCCEVPRLYAYYAMKATKQGYYDWYGTGRMPGTKGIRMKKFP